MKLIACICSLEDFRNVFSNIENVEGFHHEFVKKASEMIEANINSTFGELNLKEKFDEINKLESEYSDTKEPAW